MDGMIKYLMCFLFAFLAYNEFVLMSRESFFSQPGHHADRAEEVEAYPLCHLPLRCRGWHDVGYDARGRLQTEYRLVN
jgi:hypothetical protein